MRRLLPVVVGIIMIAVGGLLWSQNEGSSLKDQEGYYRELCEKGVRTQAVLQAQYTSTKGTAVNMVTYKYDYVVDGRTYTGEVTTNRLPEGREFEVTYLPEKPETSERGSPCKTYESIKNSSASPGLMYTGIGLFFIGVAIAWQGLRRLFQKAPRPA